MLELRRDRRRPQPPGVGAQPFEGALASLGDALGIDAASLLTDPALEAIEAELEERMSRYGAAAPYPAQYNASRALTRACWVACRGTGARLVVETGVAAGFTTSVILAALEEQGFGALHSIDVPPAGMDPKYVGWLVPDRLRHRWTLHPGRSRRVLPHLLREQPAIDLFVHDGLHTEPTMRWELRTGGGGVRPGGVVLLDDAERNPAFAEWAMTARPAWWTLSETASPGHHFGVAVLAS